MRQLARLFHRILKVQGARVCQVELGPADTVEITVSRHGNAKARCPTCGSTMKCTGKMELGRWRHLDLFRSHCILICTLRIGRCPSHGERIESVPWATPRARHTRAFDRQVASLVQVADRTAASRLFGVVWRTVERMVKRVVREELPKDLLDAVIAIGVDETSYKRGHRYVTVVTDLIERRVIWIGKGKSKDTLRAFFDELGERRAAELQVVAMDMSGAFRAVVAERAPGADVVFDRFHVVKLLLDAIDEVRRAECRKLQGDDRTELKGLRFALLANPKYKSPLDLHAIRSAVAANRRIAAAYERRISFEDLWDCETESEARAFLQRWTKSALLSQQPAFCRFARTVRAHLEGILGYFRLEGLITSGFVEGINNKIKLQLHKAYGFATVEGLMAMVMLCCTGLVLNP